MGRKFRLSRHRKNEERKKKQIAKRKKAAVDIPEPLVVSIQRDMVSVFTVKLPIEYLLSAKVTSLSVLRHRIQALHILPQGLLPV